MTVRQQWTIVAAIVGALGLGLLAAVHYFGDELFPVEVGSPAPAFTARDVRTPRTRTLADYRGQVVLLNIWATWCPPCRQEMPSMERLYRAYGPRGLRIVAVSIDELMGADSVRAFADSLGLTFDILHDRQTAITRAYQTTGYPESFVIGRDGVIRKKWIGAADWNAAYNRALIGELLGVQEPVAHEPEAADTAAATLRPASR